MATRCTGLAALVLLAALAACGGEDEVVPPSPDASLDAQGDAIPTPDAAQFCDSCGADQICVQVFNGTCGQISLACEPRNAACVGDACSAGCMQWQCNDGADPPFFRCDVGACAGVAPGVLACYGP